MTTLKKPSGTGFRAVSSNMRQAESKAAEKCALWFESSAHRFKNIHDDEQFESNALIELSMTDIAPNPDGPAPPKPQKP